MKHLLVIIISVLVLVFDSTGISNAASRSETNRVFAEAAGVYIQVKAMKWQRGRDVGTVTVKIDPNRGKAFYEGREIVIYENPKYISWGDSDPDPRTKYQWYSFVTSSENASFHLYFNYD